MKKLSEHKLSDLYDINSGLSSTPEQAGHGAPFLSFKCIFNNYFLPDNLTDRMDTAKDDQKKYSIKRGDIFLTRTSETLDELGMSSVALKDYPNATFSGFAKRLRPKQSDITYDKFMGFFLRSKYFREIINKKTLMTLRASLNETIFSHINVVLPDFADQKLIGDFLYLLQEKIELNNKINAELDAIGKNIFAYWFIQYEFPNHLDQPFKASGGKLIHNRVLNRAIPSGWMVQNFAKNRLTTAIPPGIPQFNGKKTYIPTAAVEGTDIIDISNTITFTNRESRANMQPIRNSVWFAKMKNTKKALFFGEHSHELLEQLILSTGFYGLSCNDFSLEYLWNSVNNDFFEARKSQVAHGATQQSVNDEDLKHIPFLIPDDATLKSFHSITAPFYNQLHQNILENMKFAALRDWLLPLLMNGQAQIK